MAKEVQIVADHEGEGCYVEEQEVDGEENNSFASRQSVDHDHNHCGKEAHDVVDEIEGQRSRLSFRRALSQSERQHTDSEEHDGDDGYGKGELHYCRALCKETIEQERERTEHYVDEREQETLLQNFSHFVSFRFAGADGWSLPRDYWRSTVGVTPYIL